MQYRPLGNTGFNVSVIGFGAAPLGNEFGPADFDEGVRAVHLAVDRGINFFDVSPFYGMTVAEERLGRALEGRRDKVVLATKCGRYGREPEKCDYSAARVTATMLSNSTTLLTRRRSSPTWLSQRSQTSLRKLRCMIRVWSSNARAFGLPAMELATFGDAAATSRKGIRRTASTSPSVGRAPARTIETSANPECWPGRGS